MDRNPDRNALCWCGSGVKYKKCHAAQDEKAERFRLQGCTVPVRALLKSRAQLDGIRKSGRLNSAVLDAVAKCIVPGVTTAALDRAAHDFTVTHSGIPAPLHYHGFPKSICTSVNEQVCHGIPSEEVLLQDGDIVNVDVSTLYEGFYADSSRMFCVGTISPEKKLLVQTAKECVEWGLHAVKPWGFLGDIAQAVETHARSRGVSVVEEIGGHGIGLEFHEEPWVGYTGTGDTGMLLVPGMVFTIEPMVNQGSPRVHVSETDGWTVTTADGLPSAQWEITVAVTEEGYEVLAW